MIIDFIKNYNSYTLIILSNNNEINTDKLKTILKVNGFVDYKLHDYKFTFSLIHNQWFHQYLVYK